MNEFNLSDKARNIDWVSNEPAKDGNFIHIEDVKEFIKRLKETIEEGIIRNKILPMDWCFDRIDKLAGDELI